MGVTSRKANYKASEVTLLRDLRRIHGENWSEIRRIFNEHTETKRSIGSLQSKYYDSRQKKEVGEAPPYLGVAQSLMSCQRNRGSQPKVNSTVKKPPINNSHIHRHQSSSPPVMPDNIVNAPAESKNIDVMLNSAHTAALEAAVGQGSEWWFRGRQALLPSQIVMNVRKLV
ncbi:hypothetical protein BDD12DRAFT_809726 [Trichophaea hybrida]|nr:hypothetical protein BDD12DRAFT_809726 [Trichophaea hybrida]